jgi:hypothetical protein
VALDSERKQTTREAKAARLAAREVSRVLVMDGRDDDPHPDDNLLHLERVSLATPP